MCDKILGEKYWDIAKSVRHKTLTLAFRWFESSYPSQKSESFDFRIFHLCRKAQPRLRAAHATSFSCKLTSFRRKADTSEVARSANEDGYAKRGGLTPNGVALRANGGAVVRYCA